jgi:hypothetical protein
MRKGIVLRRANQRYLLTIAIGALAMAAAHAQPVPAAKVSVAKPQCPAIWRNAGRGAAEPPAAIGPESDHPLSKRI